MLHYKIIGTGKPVIFLHGFLESISMWKSLNLEAFKFCSLLIDLPGHGKSINNDYSTVPSIEYMANEVLKVIDKLGFQSFDIIGHSMGGYIALSMKEIDSRVNKVTLLNSNFWEDSQEKVKDRIRVADIVFKNKNLFLKEAIPNLYNDQTLYKSQISELLEEALKIDSFSIAYASLAMSKRKNFKHLLINSPEDFHIIQGELDQIVFKSKMLMELAGLEVDYFEIKGTGHMSHIEHPKNISTVINSIY